MPRSEPIVLEPVTQAEYSVIWLHGLGADGRDFVPMVDELRLPPGLAIRFVFPHAPIQPVTINGGMSMRAWYDISLPDLSVRPDLTGIQRSVVLLEGLVQEQIKTGLSGDRIVLAGFSQGGVIALATALQMQPPPLGVMALSTYLPKEIAISSLSPLPIFYGHGSQDEVVALGQAEGTRDRLSKAGHLVEPRDYPMGHSVCQQEIADIRAWLIRIMSG